MADETDQAIDAGGIAESERVDDGLLSRVRLIEDRPLDDRAEAYAQVHDELLRRLESADQAADA